MAKPFDAWKSTELLMGLRHPRAPVEEMIRRVASMVLGIRGIEESWVDQDIFSKGEAKGRAEGATEEARRNLFRLGSKKLGQPDARVEAQIAAITDRERLDQLLDRVLDVSSWDELLASP